MADMIARGMINNINYNKSEGILPEKFGAVGNAYYYKTNTVSKVISGDNNDMCFTCRTNTAITVEFLDPAANSQTLAVSVLGNDITVSLATNETGVITSTANDIKAAIEANANANTLVIIANSANSNGTGAVTALTRFTIQPGKWYEDSSYTILSNDDTKSLQDAIDYCILHGIPLVSSKNKSYMITNQLNFNDRITMNFHNAKIVAGNEIDYMFYINKVWNGIYHPFGDWEKIILDGNNKAKIGIHVEAGNREHYVNLEINNCYQIGFSHNSMHEAIVRDSHIENCKIGIKSNGADCTFDNVNGRDCKTYFLLKEGARANNYINCHSRLNSGYKDSIFADVSSGAACTFRDCYSDSYQIGWRIRGFHTPIIIAGGRFLINNGRWLKEMTYEDKSYVLYYDDSDYARYTSIGGGIELIGVTNGTTYFSNMANSSYVPWRNSISGIKCYNITNPPCGLMASMTNVAPAVIEPYITFIRNLLTCPMDSHVFWTDLIFSITHAAGNIRIGLLPYYYRPARNTYGFASVHQDGSASPITLPVLPPVKFIGVAILTNGEIWINSDVVLNNTIISIQMKYDSIFTNSAGF